jgi:glycosyltransferase involved in cell wall biosynthesis
MKISTIVLTKNEEKNIEKCLKALQWCDEIIVVDDGSVDKTVILAKKLGAKVYEHNLSNNFSQQRNFGLEKAQNEWVLFVDADERVSPALAAEIQLRITNYELGHSGFYIQRLDSIWGKVLKHGETGNIKLLRLAKKDRGKWKGSVHETWDVKGEIGVLKNTLMHYPHQTLTEFLKEINFYTTLRAEELYKQKIPVSFLDIIIYPKAKFIQNYFFKLGFLDGNAGIVFALCMSFHSFLVRGKLWQLWQKK